MKDMSSAAVNGRLSSAVELIKKLDLLNCDLKDPPPCVYCGRIVIVGPPCCEMEKMRRDEHRRSKNSG